jgi:hypothetical protein
MPQVARRTKVSFDASTTMYADQITAHHAGEDLDAGAPCYIKASDNKVYMSNGTAANEAASTDGFAVMAHKAGEPVTLHGKGTRLGYGDGTLPAGSLLYIDTTKGRLNTQATTGGTTPVAKVIGATQDIRVIRDA